MTLVAASSATAHSAGRRLPRARSSFCSISFAAPLIYILLAATLVTLLLEEFIDAGVTAAGALALFRWELDETGSLTRAHTVALTTMVLSRMFHVGNCRSDYVSAFKLSPLSNPFVFIATATALLVHVGALHLRQRSLYCASNQSRWQRGVGTSLWPQRSSWRLSSTSW